MGQISMEKSDLTGSHLGGNQQDLLQERGIGVTHETVRFWWNRFGQIFAVEVRRNQIAAMHAVWHRRWHLDEVFVKINEMEHYLWRAVDHEGEVLESFVTKTQYRIAALKFLRKSLRRHESPEVIVTEGLASYGAAVKDLRGTDERNTERWLNNRTENSHLSFRRRERAMLRFRRMRSLQKFVAIHGSIHNHFKQERHLTFRQIFKARRDAAINGCHQLCAA